jgi:hypothetical protein
MVDMCLLLPPLMFLKKTAVRRSYVAFQPSRRFNSLRVHGAAVHQMPRRSVTCCTPRASNFTIFITENILSPCTKRRTSRYLCLLPTLSSSQMAHFRNPCAFSASHKTHTVGHHDSGREQNATYTKGMCTKGLSETTRALALSSTSLQYQIHSVYLLSSITNQALYEIMIAKSLPTGISCLFLPLSPQK